MSEPSRTVPGRVRPIQRDPNSERFEIRDRFPRIGEVILANIDVSTDSHETGITLTRDNTFTSFPRRSLGSKVEGERFDFKPHLFIVKNVFISASHHGFEWRLEGFVIRGYSFSGDSVQHVEHLREYNELIPLPPPSRPPLQTPASFGPPLDVPMIPKTYCWAKADIRRIDMGWTGWYRSFDPQVVLSESELARLVEHSRRANISMDNPQTSSGGPQPPAEPSETHSPVHPAPKTHEKMFGGSRNMSSVFLHDVGTQNQRRMPILVAEGAWDMYPDDESSDDLFDLDDVFRLETKESLMSTDPDYAHYVEQHDKAVRNENVYNWLRNIPSVKVMMPRPIEDGKSTVSVLSVS